MQFNIFNKMSVAIVILNWNGEKFLEKFLPGLVEHTNLNVYDLYVADNGSTDGSLQLINKLYPQIKTILFDQNYGFAGGYNKALEQINADYFLILNSDVEVSPNWLDTLYAYMEDNKDVAACQPKIKSYHNKELFEHAGAAGGFIDKYGFPFCRGRVFGTVEQDRGQYDYVSDVFWASGACLMIRSEMFRKVGGFDAEFFAHMEEIDLCWRLNSRGYRIVCVPQSVVYHVGGGTLNVEHPRKTYLNFRNNLLMLYKNLPQAEMLNILERRFFFDYAAALQLFITGKFKNAFSIYRARRDFYLIKDSFDDKRKENILYATHTSCAVMYKGSIVLDYYLKSKKTFDKIIKRKLLN